MQALKSPDGMKRTLVLCVALALASAGNILNVVAAELLSEPKPKKKALITLPEESPWRLLVDPDYEAE